MELSALVNLFPIDCVVSVHGAVAKTWKSSRNDFVADALDWNAPGKLSLVWQRHEQHWQTCSDYCSNYLTCAIQNTANWSLGYNEEKARKSSFELVTILQQSDHWSGSRTSIQFQKGATN
ncbi:hypothetical protein O6H91_06G078000 [Diphasiastrum complanatum]|uniref:Uncharacterized protein n=1 Tax=Diphasiastrum complanatum TaxID=34168 RepID=A0ACC2DF90_DIPCM|nr:hypothetical protein O6H91_Y232600 [Diphasiastrum complanatum]KAJ7552945.1 hypothetical protein O6H91_06G078000 [Diphasiastrum complanatum]